MKARVLYAEDSLHLIEVIAPVIESIIDGELVIVNSGEDAIRTLKAESYDFSCIVSDEMMVNGNGTDILKHINSLNKDIPFIFLTGEPQEILDEFPDFFKQNKHNCFLSKPKEIFKLDEALRFLSKSELEKISNYRGMKLELCLKFDLVPVDLFVKINDEKYLKIYFKNTKIVPEDFEKYKKKNIDELYVEQDEFKGFLDFIIHETISKIEKVPEEGGIGFIDDMLGIQSIIHNHMNKIGLDEKVIGVSKAAVEKTIVNIEKESRLYKIFEKMIKKNEFLYEHSMAVNILSMAILRELEWNSTDTQFKLSLAAFFHDLSLGDEFKADEFKLLEKPKFITSIT